MIKAQAALFAAKNWKKIAILILGIAFFPFMIIALMVSLTNTVSIEDDKVTLYMNISEEIGNKYGVYIDYLPAVEELFYENYGWNWISHGNIFHGYQKYEISGINLTSCKYC